MTYRERNFQLKVEELLSDISNPEYRQTVVEVFIWLLTYIFHCEKSGVIWDLGARLVFVSRFPPAISRALFFSVTREFKETQRHRQENVITKLKERRLRNERPKFAYLTVIKSGFARFARAFFIFFVHFIAVLNQWPCFLA